jgi:hypothetical protein
VKPVDFELVKRTLETVIEERRARVGGDHRLLRVFLSHPTPDKPRVRKLYEQLKRDGFLPWLDEKDLFDGQDWKLEIRRAVRDADVVLVCLSNAALQRTGYLHKEIHEAIDRAEEQPEGKVSIIPVKFEACELPDRLNRWHCIDLSYKNGYRKLLASLQTKQGPCSRECGNPTDCHRHSGVRHLPMLSYDLAGEMIR